MRFHHEMADFLLRDRLRDAFSRFPLDDDISRSCPVGQFARNAVNLAAVGRRPVVPDDCFVPDGPSTGAYGR